MTLLTFSMAASVSCANLPVDFPKPPSPVLKQTLIDQKVCEPGGGNCRIINECWLWKHDGREWKKVGSGPLKNPDHEKSCHGSFGLSAKELNEGQEFIRRVEAWCRRHNCDGSAPH